MPTVVALLPAPPAARMCGRKHVQAQLNRTNITGLSVTDSSITWYEFKNRPNQAGGGLVGSSQGSRAASDPRKRARRRRPPAAAAARRRRPPPPAAAAARRCAIR